MTMTPEEIAAQTVERIFEDIRDRRFLKWVFSEEPSKICEHFDSIDLDVQDDIRFAWAKEIAQALADARAQERERCARICRKWIADLTPMPGDAFSYAARSSARAVAENIEDAIRQSGES